MNNNPNQLDNQEPSMPDTDLNRPKDEMQDQAPDELVQDGQLPEDANLQEQNTETEEQLEQSEEEQSKENEKKPNNSAKEALGWIGLSFAIVSAVAFFIISNFITFQTIFSCKTWLVICLVLAGVGFLFGLIAAIVGKKLTEWKPFAALLVSLFTLAFAITELAQLQNAKATYDTLSESIEKAAEEEKAAADKAATTTTTDPNATKKQEVVQASVSIGSFYFKAGELVNEYYLPVTIKNSTSQAHSFVVEIEAVNSAGTRIASERIDVSNLASGQSVDKKCFESVDSNLETELQKAKFQVITNKSIDN